MTRRKLLHVAMLAGAQSIVAGGCHLSDKGSGSSAAARSAAAEPDLSGLQQAMESGALTSARLTRRYLDRIADLDRSGPSLNSVIELNPDALDIARDLDRERRARGPRGPLHGVPVLLKDNIDTHDRMMTTAGSLALEGHIAAQDAAVAHRLRAAGAVILGKTNLSEWANFRSTRSTSGWSGRGGLTRNPYALDRNPSGSSSGSAVAVAAHLCAAAVGTETNGSIMSPSAVCGVVGIKPTVGLLSRTGIIPISHTQDTAGPMARSVRDAAVLLSAMAGPDPSDSATRDAEGHIPADYTAFLQADGLKGARIGVARRFFRSDETKPVFEAALDAMKRAGAVLIDPADFPSREDYENAEYQLLLYEFKAGLNAYLAAVGPQVPVHSLEDVIRFNERNSAKEMPWFGQEILLAAEKMGPLSEQKYLDVLARCRRLARTEGIDAIMAKHQLDAIVAPSGGPAGSTDLLYGDRDVGGSSSPAAIAGYPNISVPAGDLKGLPVGISFFGRAWSESVLIRLAYAFEQSTLARRAPRFPPTLA